MPIDKNQFERRNVLHAQLNTLLKFDWKQLSDRCAAVLGEEKRPSMRTIRNDIAHLRELGAPIPHRANKYHYTHYFSLFDQFETSEVALMNEIINLLARLEGITMFKHIEEFQLKIRQQLHHSPIIHFEDNPHYQGREHLSALFNHILKKQPLCLKYVDFAGQVHPFELHPYLLKEYNNRWFLYGRNHVKPEQLLNLALDRIRAFEPLKINFEENNTWDFDFYFDSMVGVTRLDNPSLQMPQEVKIRVYGPAIDYILTKPIHHSQILAEETDDTFILKVILNQEFKNTLLAFGSHIEVLEPPTLRLEMKQTAQALTKMYENLIV